MCGIWWKVKTRGETRNAKMLATKDVPNGNGTVLASIMCGPGRQNSVTNYRSS